MKKLLLILLTLIAVCTPKTLQAAGKYDNPDTLVVARDGTGQFRTVGEALEVCRAFMDYTKVIYIKKGVYKEKLVVPSWLTHITLCGEDHDHTVITWDDHANIQKMGTFRTYTLRVDGQYITLRNLTIENNAARLGQAVALHTEGDHIRVDSCRVLGNQDTVYTGRIGSRVAFYGCYIEGTTDFIFGSATAWFEGCELHSKANSYITAASTPADRAYGYVFHKCRLTAAPGIDRVYLGRPWRPYAATLFIDCEMGAHIRPEGWHNWNNAKNETTARYAEYANHGPGAATGGRASWSRQLSRREAAKVTPGEVLGQ